MRLWVFYTTSVQVKYRLRKTPEFVTNNKNILSSVRWRKNLLSSLFESWENFTESTYLPKNNLLGFDDISQHGIKGRKEIRFEQFAATIHVKFREDCLYVLVYKLWSDYRLTNSPSIRCKVIKLNQIVWLENFKLH